MHIPVLLTEVLEALSPADGETYIDGTFGAGGYTRAILEHSKSSVLAFDRDPTAIAGGAALAEQFSPRLTLFERPFSEMEVCAHEAGFNSVDGVVLDIGVSSMQLDQAERGFSFLRDGPLDMRMSLSGPTAADVVNTMDEQELADVLYQLGEERRSRAIARAIARRRSHTPFSTTQDLASVVEGVLGRPRHDEKHPATRTFQALRIHVNNELGELSDALSAAERVLKPNGRLVVVTFHSLEDRLVKRFFQKRSGKTSGVSRYVPAPDKSDVHVPSFQIVNARGVTAGNSELAVNPRARSARLRSGIRTSGPAWPSDD